MTQSNQVRITIKVFYAIVGLLPEICISIVVRTCFDYIRYSSLKIKSKSSIDLSFFPYLDNNNCEKRYWYRGPTTNRHQQAGWIHSQNVRAPA